MPHTPTPSGHSGCRIEIAGDGTVSKSATGPLARRLERQAAKQRLFRTNHPAFAACAVLTEQWSPDRSAYTFTMPYHRHLDVTSWLDRAGADEVASVFSQVVAMVQGFISASPLRSVPREVIWEKSVAVAKSIRIGPWRVEFASAVDAHLAELQALPDEIALPIGRCHGDLTLSNVLFAADTAPHILLDFLDGYLESPVLDIAKLRQETLSHWSSVTAHRPHDEAKFATALRHLDQLVCAQLIHGRPWAPWMPALTRQTLLRVVPYITETAIAAAVRHALDRLSQETFA